MSLRIIKPGFLSTIQDIGRWGFQSYGVPVSGAMDVDALASANILVGNDENSCGIEFTMHGAEIEACDDLLIAFCGGGTRITINDFNVPFGRPVHIGKESVLKFNASAIGCRSYLAVAGGFQVEKIMNSVSTYLPSGFGGIKGRPLQSGDRIEVGRERSSLSAKIASALSIDSRDLAVASWGVPQSKPTNNTIRVLQGPEWDWISAQAKEIFFQKEFLILPSSNRIGYRLQGDIVQRVNTSELLSTAVLKGTIQNTPDGNIILLMSDCQTTGGYPRIAQVASVDLSHCAQCRVADRIQFSRISFDEAEQLLLEKQRTLLEMKRGIATRFSL